MVRGGREELSETLLGPVSDMVPCGVGGHCMWVSLGWVKQFFNGDRFSEEVSPERGRCLGIIVTSLKGTDRGFIACLTSHNMPFRNLLGSVGH